MRAVQLSRRVRRAIPFRWWQPGKVAPVDCTGFSHAIGDCTLPYPPVVEPVDPVSGRFRFAPPSAEQAQKLEPGRTYGAQVVLLNAAGEAIEEFRCEFEAV